MYKTALISENSFFKHAFLHAIDPDTIDIVVQACAPQSLVSQYRGTRLDLAVFERATVDDRFLDGLATLHLQRPNLKSLLILPSFDLGTLAKVYKIGCVGCLSSTVPVDAVPQYLLLASRGQRVLPDNAVDMLQAVVKQKEPSANAEALKSKLTCREGHVLSHLLTGEQNKQIASRLNLPLTTVKGDIKSIMRKTGAQNRTALAIAAVKTGWSEPLAQI